MKVSDYRLDQLRLGELGPDEERETLAALERAGEMHRLDELIDAADNYHTTFPPEVAIAQIRETRRRLDRQTPEKKSMTPKLALATTFVAVAASIYALHAAERRTAPADRGAAAPVGELAAPTIEELFAKAERLDQNDDVGSAADIYGRIADNYSLEANPGVYLQALVRRGLYENAKGDLVAARERFSRVVALHTSLQSPTARATDAAAQAQFVLADEAAVAAVSEGLDTEDEGELKDVLRRKTDAAKSAQNQLEMVIAYDRPRWSIAAYNRSGVLYREFANSIRRSVIPDDLSPAQSEAYRQVLETSATQVEQSAIQAFGAAVRLSTDEGITTADTSAARLSLAQLSQRGPRVDDAPGQVVAQNDGPTTAPPDTGSGLNGNRSSDHEVEQNRPGQLSRSAVKKTITDAASDLDQCGAQSGPGGTAKVRFHIRPDGTVRDDARVVSSRHQETEQGACLVQAVRRLRFPATNATKDVPVTYPFLLGDPNKSRKPTNSAATADGLYHRALQAMLKGSYREAIELNGQAIERGCKSKCLRLAGMAHHKLGESRAACKFLTRAGSELPDGLRCD